MNTTKKEKYIPLSTKVIEVHGELGFCHTADPSGMNAAVAIREWEDGLGGTLGSSKDEGGWSSSSKRRGW